MSNGDDDDSKWTVAGRTAALNGFFADAYIKHIQSSSQSKSAAIINDIFVDCSSNGVPSTKDSPACSQRTKCKDITQICNTESKCVEGLCEKCLLNFVPKSALLHQAPSKALVSLQTGVCQGCCTCGVHDVLQRTGVVFDTTAKVSVTPELS